MRKSSTPPLNLVAKKAPSHRQLRISEEVRQILSSIIARGDFFTPELRNLSITITQVTVSPDLRNALILFMPLGGKNQVETLRNLKKYRNEFRYLLAKEIQLRYVPNLRFALDSAIDEGEKMGKLFAQINQSHKIPEPIEDQ